jgi:hypothetical protein
MGVISNPSGLVKGLNKSLENLEGESRRASYLVSVGPFGVPNQFLGLDLRNADQKKAMDAPQQFQTAMEQFLKEISKAQDLIAKASQP